jgi:hypothetical protein
MTPATLDQITAITDASARHWQPFDAVSPGGISFSGYLCRQESDKLGMLAVTRLDGQERLEFIPAMPKIHYPYVQDREGRLQVSIPVPINVADARFTVKLDGTAIIFYPLTAPGGAVLEVIPRTRLLPVLAPSRWGDWHGLLAEVLPDGAVVALCGTLGSGKTRLVQAIASMTTPDGNTIVVPGFYDGILPPTEEQKRLINGMAGLWDDDAMQQVMDVLRRKKVKATFFMLGDLVGRDPSAARR